MIGDPPMNFLSCSVAREQGKLRFVGEGFRCDVPQALIPRIEALLTLSNQLVMGIRPIDLQTTENTETDPVLKGEVFVLEPAGAKQILTVSIGKNLVKVVVDAFFKAEIGQHITLKMNTQKLSVFDGNTLKSIA